MVRVPNTCVGRRDDVCGGRKLEEVAELRVCILDLRPRGEQRVVLDAQLLDGALNDVERVVERSR